MTDSDGSSSDRTRFEEEETSSQKPAVAAKPSSADQKLPANKQTDVDEPDSISRDEFLQWNTKVRLLLRLMLIVSLGNHLRTGPFFFMSISTIRPSHWRNRRPTATDLGFYFLPTLSCLADKCSSH